MSDFWQTLAAVFLGGVLTLLTGYMLWKAERRAALREHRREAIQAAHSSMYEAYNAIEDYGVSVAQGEETLAVRITVRHATNEFLKRNMWLGGSFDDRGDKILVPIAGMEQALQRGEYQTASEAAETLRTNTRVVMAQYREMLHEVERQEAGVLSTSHAKIKAARK